MTNILLGIWQNAPIWVWPLFVVLLVMGLSAMRDRNSSIIPYFFLPLLGLSTVNSMGALAHVPLNWISFGLSYLLGTILAFRWQNGLILEKSGWRMRLKGERITLLILMLIFVSNFVSGVISSVAPHLQGLHSFTAIFASIIGACSGSFTGRALRVITVQNRVSSAE